MPEPLVGPRVTVDRDNCDLHGLCAATAPEVFRLDDTDDEVVVLADPVPAALLPMARAAADACPKSAVRLVGFPVDPQS